MECALTQEKVQEFILTLARGLKSEGLDYSMCYSYDEMAKYFLNLKEKKLIQSEETLWKSLFSFAYFYDYWESLKDSQFKSGKAKKLISEASLLSPLEFNRYAAGLYNFKNLYSDFDYIQSTLNELIKYQKEKKLPIINGEIKKLSDSIRDYFKKKEGKEKEIEFVTLKLKELLDNQPEDYINQVEVVVNSTINFLSNSNSFVDLSGTFSNLIEEGIFTLKDLTSVKGFRETLKSGGYIYTLDDGTNIKVEEFLKFNSLKPSTKMLTHSFQFFEPNDKIKNGVNISPISNEPLESYKRIVELIKQGGKVSIKAVPYKSEVNSILKSKIEALDEDLKPLVEKRTIYTFESKKQIEYLQTNDDFVITFGELPPSQTFELIGEINDSGGVTHQFRIQPFNNMVLLHSNNTTEYFDFNNPEHVKELYNPDRVFYKYSNSSPKYALTKNDINQIKSVIAAFNNLSNELKDLSSVQDITELFNSHFDLSSNPTHKKSEVLSKTLESDIYKEFEIHKLDDDNNPVFNRTERVPFILSKTKGGIYKLFDTLNEDEYIFHDGEIYSQYEYLTDVLKIDFDLISKEISNLTSSSTSIKYERLVLLILNDGSYKLYESYQEPLGKQMGEIIPAIHELISKAGTSNFKNVVKEFDVNFATFSKLGQKAGLYVNFTNSKTNNLKLELTPNNTVFNFIRRDEKEHVKSFYLLDTFTSYSFITKDYLPSIRENFKDLNLPKDDLELIKYMANSPIKELNVEYEEIVTLYTESLNKDIQDYIEILEKDVEFKSTFSEFYPGFEIKDLFTRDYNVSRNKRERILRLKYNGKQAAVPNRNFNSNIISGITESYSNFIFKPILNAPPIAKTTVEDVQKLPRKVTRKNGKGGDKFGNFSIATSFTQESIADRLKAINLIKSILPSFQIIEADLQEIFKDEIESGNVLGYFENNILYLDSILRGEGTVYHEAFHGVFNSILTETQRLLLIDEESKLYKVTDEELVQFGKNRKLKYNINVLRRLFYEERIADKFKAFMLNKTKTKTILDTIFDLIKNLINLFKSRAYRDIIFEDIYKGEYKNEILKENEDSFKRYSLIPGLLRVYNSDEELVSELTYLKTKDLNELVNFLTSVVVNKNFDNKKEEIKNPNDAKFDLLFEEARKIAINEYDTERFISDNKGQFSEITISKFRAKYFDLWSNYRFMLGYRKYSGKLDALLDLGDLENVKDGAFSNIVNDENGLEVDNTYGDYSLSRLKQLVRKNVNDFYSVEIINSEQIEEENVEVDEDLDNQDTDDENEDSVNNEDIDEGYGTKNPLRSISFQFKRFLSQIRVEVLDEEVGVKIPMMLDVNEIANYLLNISSGVKVEDIISNLKYYADLHSENNNIYISDILNSVYDSLIKEENIGGQLYNSIIDFLNKVSLDYVMVDVKKSHKEFRVEFKDKVLQSDINSKLKSITSEIISKNQSILNGIGDLNSYLKSKTEFSKLILTKLNPTTFSKLVKTSVALKESLIDLGINIPLQVIKLSLLVANPKIKSTPELKQFKEANKNYIRNGQFLELDFFKSLNNIFINDLLDSNLKLNKSFYKGFNDNFHSSFTNRSKTPYSIFYSTLRKAMPHLLKFDYYYVPSTIKNAEGKPIWRYAVRNSFLNIIESIKLDGITSISSDPNYKYYKDFLNDNSIFGEYLKYVTEFGYDNIPKQLQWVHEFFSNFSGTIFGGLNYSAFGQETNKAVYKNTDPKALHLLNLYNFTNRQKLSNGRFIFKRQFHQLESISTNFLISSISLNLFDYTKLSKLKFINNKIDKADFFNVSENVIKHFKNILEQEYKRINREFNKIQILKEELKSGVNNVILNYSGVLRKNENGDFDLILDDPKLRAFKFNLLSDFNEISKLSTSIPSDFLSNLIQSAKSGEPFQVSDNIIFEYIYSNFKIYLESLAKFNVITQNTNGTYIKGFPTTFIEDSITVNLNTLYYNKNDKKIFNTSSFLTDYFFNSWLNALNFNQIFDGDLAIHTSSFSDYVKRLKKYGSYGSTLKGGDFKVAHINEVLAILPTSTMSEFGAFVSNDQIDSIDPYILDDEDKEKLKLEFNSKSSLIKILDGQCFANPLHYVDYYDTLGRKDFNVFRLLIQNCFRELNDEEVKTLIKNKAINNSKKTVTASGTLYIKNSETVIHRRFASKLNFEFNDQDFQFNGVDYTTLVQNNTAYYLKEGVIINKRDYYKASEVARSEKLNDIYNKLTVLYEEVYHLRKEIKKNPLLRIQNEIKIKELFKSIHSHFSPLPHRKYLHDLLNSIEYHNVDIVGDTTVFKNASNLPLDIFKNINLDGEVIVEPSTDNLYNLNFSSFLVNSNYKFFQVETSGVSNNVRGFIQRKLLIASDLNNLESYLITVRNKEGLELSEYDKLTLKNVSDDLKLFLDSLKKISDTKLNIFSDLILKDGKISIPDLFNLIQKNLLTQGYSTDFVELFSVTNGELDFNHNFPDIRKILSYYFFSLFSSNLIEDSVKGYKFYHVTSFGADVLVDKTNHKVITTSEYLRNSKNYPNVYHRPLGVDISERNGVRTYMLECIIPKSQFRNKQEEDKFIEDFGIFLGSRIPTQDKSSIVVLKVVDFSNSSDPSKIIVNPLVHYLSGSDLDIDTLYCQFYSSYNFSTDILRKQGEVIYNDERQLVVDYIQYLKYLSNLSPVKNLILNRKDLYKNTEVGVKNSSILLDHPKLHLLQPIFKALGYTTKHYSDLKYSNLNALLNDEYSKTLQKTLNSLYDKEFYNKTRHKNPEVLIEIETELYKEHQLVNLFAIIRDLMSVITVFEELGKDIFYNPKINYSSINRESLQNQNLKSQINILSNSVVFENLYINESVTDNEFNNVINSFGLNIEDFLYNGNIFTPNVIVDFKNASSVYGKAISGTAYLNKIAAFDSITDLSLKHPVLNKSHFTRFIDGYRSIKTVGAMIGVYTDGMKTPIPTVLNINEANFNTTNVILSLGGFDNKLPSIFGLNYIGLIYKSSLNIDKSIIGDNSDVFFPNSLNNNILKYYETFKNHPSEPILTFDTESTEIFKFLFTRLRNNEPLSIYNKKIDYKQFTISFNPQNLKNKIKELKAGELTSKDVGYTIKLKNNNVTLTEKQADFLLANIYLEAAWFTQRLYKPGNILKPFKKLNPDLDSIEKIKLGIDSVLNNESIYDGEDFGYILQDSIWGNHKRIVDTILNLSSNVFLEKHHSFNFLYNFAKSFIKSNEQLNTLFFNGISVKLFKEFFVSRCKVPENIKLQLQERLNRAFSYEYLTDDYIKDDIGSPIDAYERLIHKYPDNAFLNHLSVNSIPFSKTMKFDFYARTSNVAVVNLKYLTLRNFINKKDPKFSRVKDEALELFLYKEDEDILDFEYLFYHVMATNGFTALSNNPLNLFPNQLRKRISKLFSEFYSNISNEYDTIPKALHKMGYRNPLSVTTELYNSLINEIIKTVNVPMTNFVYLDKDSNYEVLESEFLNLVFSEEGYDLVSPGKYPYFTIPYTTLKSGVKYYADSFNIDTSNFFKISNQRILRKFLKTFGINQTEDNRYLFPYILKVLERKKTTSNDDYDIQIPEKYSYYILKGVNGRNISDTINEGYSANYEKINIKAFPKELNMSSYSTEELNNFSEAVNNKDIDFVYLHEEDYLEFSIFNPLVVFLKSKLTEEEMLKFEGDILNTNNYLEFTKVIIDILNLNGKDAPFKVDNLLTRLHYLSVDSLPMRSSTLRNTISDVRDFEPSLEKNYVNIELIIKEKYDTLTEEQKEKVGSLENLINKYNQIPFEIDVESFIEQEIDCKL